MTPPIRVLVADDHMIVRTGIRHVLESEPGFEVVGEAANGAEALSLTAKLRPDVVVLDISMPDVSGLELAAQLRSTGAGTRVVLRKRRRDFLLGHDFGRLRRDDGRRQLVVFTKIGDRRDSAVAHDLDPALVDVALREHLVAAAGLDDDARPHRLHDGPFLHLGHNDWRHRGRRRDVRGAGHARLQLTHRQLLAVDVEAEVVGHREFSRAFGQLDHEGVAVDRDDLKLLGLR